ncbi:MAG: MFS transporter [Bacillota bacterium]|nr:MFS transporter [Bacillota bacterium]
MSQDTKNLRQRRLLLFCGILAAIAVGNGFFDGILANYLREVYAIDALQRGLIELPRELPGVLTVVLVSVLTGLGNRRMGVVATVLMLFGLLVLGFVTPPFAIMLIFLFIHSTGMHLWFPLDSSIGMSLISDESRAGTLFSRFKAVSTAAGMLVSLLVFLGFNRGWFSFQTEVKVVFLIGAAGIAVAMLLLLALERTYHNADTSKPADTKAALKRPRFVFRREYRFYYVLQTMHGVQKQIMAVFAPWILITLLDQGADTLALLALISSGISIFFVPLVGQMLDRLGIRVLVFIEAFTFIIVYICFGLLAAGFIGGWLLKSGWAFFLTCALFVLDRLSMQLAMVHAMYLRSIAISAEDIAPALSTGQAMDHVVSITMALASGWIWTTVGPQYVFFSAAALSLINAMVAFNIPRRRTVERAPELSS